jgi:hypothetical protein
MARSDYTSRKDESNLADQKRALRFSGPVFRQRPPFFVDKGIPDL